MLVGLDGAKAAVWNVYSESVKPGGRVEGDAGYNFYESVVDLLRPSVKQGIKSILIATPDERAYRGFIDHIEKHQGWLLKGWELNRVAFEHIPQPAMDADQVRDLIRSHDLRGRLSEVTRVDLNRVMGILEKRLNDPKLIDTILYTLREAEDAVYGRGVGPEYVLVTEGFRSRNRRRVDKLLQVATNKGFKTRVVESDTPAGFRLSQFGGLVCILSE